MAGLFQVLHGNADGTFRRAEVLKGADGEPLIIPLNGRQMTENICTRPFAFDWDGDGHLDLVVGNFAGTFHLFKGLGKGKFTPEPVELKAGEQPLKIEGSHSDPFVVDWDGDGDPDLLSGSSQGGVQWAENRAGPGKTPRLEPFRTLIEPAPQREHGQILRDEDLKMPLGCTRVWVDDVNSDGKLDILVGDMVTLVSPAANLTEEDFKKKLADWNKLMGEASRALNATADDPTKRTEAMQRYQTLHKQQREFMTEDRTGFVWLFLRK